MEKEQNMIEVVNVSEPLPLTKEEKVTLLTVGALALVGGLAGVIAATTGNIDSEIGLVSGLSGFAGGDMLYSLYRNYDNEKNKTKVR